MASRRSLRLLKPAFNGIVAAERSCSQRAIALSRPLTIGSTPACAIRRRQATNTDTKQCRFASSEAGEVRKTPLYDLNAEYGGKFVPFGGFSMPVQYGDLSVGESHKWTREKASIFDVSHM